jgi:hypothetical protein
VKTRPDFWDSGIPYEPLPEATRRALAEERKVRMAAAAETEAKAGDPHGWGKAFAPEGERRRRERRPNLGELA